MKENTWKSFCFSFFRLALEPMISVAIVIATSKLHGAFFLVCLSHVTQITAPGTNISKKGNMNYTGYTMHGLHGQSP